MIKHLWDSLTGQDKVNALLSRIAELEENCTCQAKNGVFNRVQGKALKHNGKIK